MCRLFRSLAPALAAAALLLAAAPAAAAPRPLAAALPTCDGATWAPINVSTQRFLPTYLTVIENCMLQQNDFNNFGVVALQDALITCYGQSITRDGDFGPDTEKALKTVQAWEQYMNHKPIGVTGVYKPPTRDAIQWPAYKNGAYKGCTYDW
jgi:hypothetical protein